MARRLDTLKDARLVKLEQIKKLGIDPYPSSYKNRILAKESRELLDKKVNVAGRISGWREHGGSIFSDLRDESGQIQLWFQKDKLGEEFEKLQLLDLGDFIGVSGQVVKTKAGEITVSADNYRLLSKSLRPLPSEWYGLKDIEERYRQRYADLLINPEVKEKFLLRSKFVKMLREYLDKEGFVEVETPILQPIYGGASARPFTTHHKTLDTNLYLRISDELYLKRLIVGGFEKVYEIGKDFRNEGIDKQHNPEFTQIEFYWAYADYEDLIKFTEEMLTQLIGKVKGALEFEYQGTNLNFSSPWKRVKFRDAVKNETGIDIDKEDTEEKLLAAVKEKNLDFDRKGVVGYGMLVDRLYKQYVRPKLIQPTLVMDYPTEIIALAKRKKDDPSKIASFQLLVCGFEIIKAYNELNDPQDQKARWEEMDKLAQKGLEEHETLDEDYIRALEYGMPPTAGWGMGIDRIVTFLTDSPNLKEVILFPTLRPEK